MNGVIAACVQGLRKSEHKGECRVIAQGETARKLDVILEITRLGELIGGKTFRDVESVFSAEV